MKRFILTAVLAAQTALAAPVLNAVDAAALDKAIAQAKQTNPSSFAAVEAVKAAVPTLDTKKRALFAPVTPRLKAIPNATWALANAVMNGSLAADATPSAQIAWQTGVLEALGSQRDVATEPLLIAALTSAEQPEVVRSAAEALGQLGTDRANTVLIAQATSRTGAARIAVLAGMGSCRRVATADFLAKQLSLTVVEKEQLAIVKSLSLLGNEWALATPAGAPVKAEVPQLRAIVAGALVKLFASSSGNVRQQASDAILVVSAPETKLLLAQVRVKDPAAVDALLSKVH